MREGGKGVEPEDLPDATFNNQGFREKSQDAYAATAVNHSVPSEGS
jgi:hypothetical protein